MEKLRVGLIGCGEAVQILHLPSLYQLSNQFEVTAICDISRQVVEELGTRWNIPKRFVDDRELLAQNDVDAVVIASPNHYHASSTLKAIAAGKHVLVEKPMCITLREADEVIAAAAKSGVTVQVAYMRRYASAFLEACEIVRAMEGDIQFARVHDIIGQNALIIQKTSRVVRGSDIPAAVLESSRATEKALFDEALGESPQELRRAYGMLLGLASHDISAMRELIGMPKSSLYAAYRQGGSYITGAFDYGHFTCHLEIGVDVMPRFDGYLQVYGQKIIVRVEYDTPYVRNLPTRLRVTEVDAAGRISNCETNPAWGDNFTLEWKVFYDNIQQRKQPKTSPQDFRHDLEIFSEMVELMRPPLL
jgi:predicted dehydrogenase